MAQVVPPALAYLYLFKREHLSRPFEATVAGWNFITFLLVSLVLEWGQIWGCLETQAPLGIFRWEPSQVLEQRSALSCLGRWEA